MNTSESSECPQLSVLASTMETIEEENTTVVRGRALPWNSRRLTKAHLQALGLELSPTTAADELRLMVEEKLREMGREPMSVRVVCSEGEVKQISLEDENGVFLSVDPY